MQEKIKTLQIIHLALCAGVLLAYLLLGDISMDTLTIPTIGSPSNIFFALPFIALGLGNLLFHLKLKKIDKNLKAEDNFEVYQTASIIRWAVLEGAAFMILFLTPDYLIFGFFVIVVMVFLRPTEARIKAGLQYLD